MYSNADFCTRTSSGCSPEGGIVIIVKHFLTQYFVRPVLLYLRLVQELISLWLGRKVKARLPIPVRRSWVENVVEWPGGSSHDHTDGEEQPGQD